MTLCYLCGKPVRASEAVEHDSWEYPHFRKVSKSRHVLCRPPLSLQPSQ